VVSDGVLGVVVSWGGGGDGEGNDGQSEEGGVGFLDE